MKKIRTLLAAFLLAFTSMTANAQPMSYMSMCNNARFITDRMAYTLGITAIDLIDDLFRINFDYICGVNDYLDDVAMGYRYDDYMAVCYERDRAIQRLLGMTLWNRVLTYDYFYRPIVFNDCRWSFGIYVHDSNIHHFYYHVPRYYNTYHGGHYFAGMRPLPGGGRGHRGVIPSRPNYHHPGFNQPAHRDGGVVSNHSGGYTPSHRNDNSHFGGNGNNGYHVGANNNNVNVGGGNHNNGNTGYTPNNTGGASNYNPNRGNHSGSNTMYNGGGRNTGSVGVPGGSRTGGSRSSTNSNSSSRSTRSGSPGHANRTGGIGGSHRSGGHR